MALTSPFDRAGTWLRCALHTHTTGSDGELAPDRLVAHYERAGYDAVCLTDHWARTVAPSTPHAIAIPGVELNATLAGSGRDAHVLGLGVADDPVDPGRTFPDLRETVDWVTRCGGVAFLAHPYWSGIDAAELHGCPGLSGIEVYNAGCELEIGRGLAGVHWDAALEAGTLLTGIATDDSHLPGYDSGLAAVLVRVEARTGEAVIEALRSGCFYSTTGPAIESVEVEERAVVVRCSPAASVTLVSAPMGGARANAGRMGNRTRARVLEQTGTGELVEVRLERWPSMPYGRIEVEDARGGRAWTNPLF